MPPFHSIINVTDFSQTVESRTPECLCLAEGVTRLVEAVFNQHREIGGDPVRFSAAVEEIVQYVIPALPPL